jgi:CDGSH-type Zn-finger protein
MTTPGPKIETIAHGPYEVTGNAPLRTRRVVRSERDEPIAWQTGPEVDHDSPYYLCRCGKSADKPFCDGSHAFELFDGAETASDNSFDERVETYVGIGITIRKDDELCQHAQFCKFAETNWFELIPETADTSRRSQLVAMIDRCPSGALAYEIEGERIEAPLRAEIAAVVDGPLFVSGEIPVERSDGRFLETRNRVVLCRCGGSANKPLCDGSHIENGFRS